MASVGITELKAHLSDYLRRAQAGERFYVTYRGVEVAELGPPDPVRAALWRMVADGEAEWSGGKPVLPKTLPKNTGRMLSDIVLEDRGPCLPEVEEKSK
jgi:prevent-host-death family protein